MNENIDPMAVLNGHGRPIVYPPWTSWVALFIVVSCLLALWSMPIVIAIIRKHPYVWQIAIASVAFGFPGWAVALAIALLPLGDSHTVSLKPWRPRIKLPAVTDGTYEARKRFKSG